MKVSKENYNKIKKAIQIFLNENKIENANYYDINNIHFVLCLNERQPNNINSINLRKKYKVNIKNYFTDYYLSNNSLNDNHIYTVLNKILKEINQ
jgi:hypothetical protein